MSSVIPSGWIFHVLVTARATTTHDGSGTLSMMICWSTSSLTTSTETWTCWRRSTAGCMHRRLLTSVGWELIDSEITFNSIIHGSCLIKLKTRLFSWHEIHCYHCTVSEMSQFLYTCVCKAIVCSWIPLLLFTENFLLVTCGTISGFERRKVN